MTKIIKSYFNSIINFIKETTTRLFTSKQIVIYIYIRVRGTFQQEAGHSESIRQMLKRI